MTNKRRAYRVGEKLHGILAGELQRVADPRFHLVTVTSVVVSPDLHYASVYWMVTGGAERADEVKEAFESAGPRLRRAVAGKLGIRFTPELRFFYDDTLDTVDRIDQLLSSINDKS